jgi:hypothetical protein
VRGKTLSGYFDDPSKMAETAARLSGKAAGVYLVLNEIDPRLLARAVNRMVPGPKATTRDVDILRRRFLLIDIDARLPAGIATTDAEHDAAIAAAYRIRDYLLELGAPEDSVVVGDSGNGGHVLVRIELPNDDESKALVNQCLKALASRFDDDDVCIDTTVGNAARIWKQPGTMARKGNSTPDRPHRIARLLEVPETEAVSSREVLEKLASEAPPDPQPAPRSAYQGQGQQFNLETWLAEHEIVVKRVDAYQGGSRYILRECPFNPKHAGTSVAIIQSAEGAIGFKCQHNSCADRKWADVRELKEPGYRRRDGGDKEEYTYRCNKPGLGSKRDKRVTETVTDRGSDSDGVTLAQSIEEWFKDSHGWCSYDALDADLGLRSPQQKANRRQIIKRLREQGIVEANPKDNRLVRFVNTNVRLIDFKAATKRTPLDIHYPFGLEQYVRTYAGNVIVVAGAPDAGKTGLLLNFVRLNQDRFPIYYQCSEMEKDELASRLVLFEGMDLEDWSFVAERRSSDFADVIRPDCVNVIDYMELTTDLYLVAEYLKAIHDKLASGIAVIALQKKRGVDLGRGGEFSLEKPRLYLSMDKGYTVIQKAKNWVSPTLNPNDLRIEYKIVGGCKFIITKHWHDPDDPLRNVTPAAPVKKEEPYEVPSF